MISHQDGSADRVESKPSQVAETTDWREIADRCRLIPSLARPQRHFDRDGTRRIPFLSAMRMLGAKGNDTRSYMEIVDALRLHGAAPKPDMNNYGAAWCSTS